MTSIIRILFVVTLIKTREVVRSNLKMFSLAGPDAPVSLVRVVAGWTVMIRVGTRIFSIQFRMERLTNLEVQPTKDYVLESRSCKRSGTLFKSLLFLAGRRSELAGCIKYSLHVSPSTSNYKVAAKNLILQPL